MPTTSTSGYPAPLGPSVFISLDRARASLIEATMAESPADRYVAAHVAALRIAAAVLAGRTGPASRRGQRNAWSLLAKVAPELSEWAAFFAAGAGKRAAAEAGLRRAVSSREADDLLRDAERFLVVVERFFELPHQPALLGPALLDRSA
jgi:SAV_6107-like HEPN